MLRGLGQGRNAPGVLDLMGGREMARHHGGGRPLVVQQARGPAVQRGPFLVGHVVEYGCLCARVPDPAVAQQPRVGQRGDRTVHGVLVPTGEHGDDGRRGVVAENGDGPCDVCHVRRAAMQTGDHHPGEVAADEWFGPGCVGTGVHVLRQRA
jgi:hypothetical protein